MAAKTYMGMPPDQQDWQRVRQMVTNMAWGERDRILARKSERDVKTDQFRWQLADSAGELDDSQCLSILAPLLGDDEPSVRMSAASALLDQSDPGSADLLFRALTLDYGAEQDISRNPEIHAAVTRRLIRTFPDHPATPQALSRAVQSDSPSVRFLALTAQQQLADQTVMVSTRDRLTRSSTNQGASTRSHRRIFHRGLEDRAVADFPRDSVL